MNPPPTASEVARAIIGRNPRTRPAKLLAIQPQAMKRTKLLGESATEPPSAGYAPEEVAAPRVRLIRRLGERLIDAQRPLRLLDAIAWDASAEEAFFASGCRDLPRIDRASYLRRPL